MSQAAAQQPSRKKAVISLLVLLALTCIIVFTFKDHWAEITAALAQLSVWQVLAVLAVGLCYGIETDVVQMVAQYIIRLHTARGELDSVLRAAFCHHPENYISLMEYYTPEEHGMEPFTRK